ncbi:MAG: adenylate/guanylate cyclase domain-containing protein [Acidimicrobiia bacterium]
MTAQPTLPDGVVTFLFTDVEGSTRLWEEAPDTMMEALKQHDDAIHGAVDPHNGVAVKPRGEGDSRFIVFESPQEAVAAAADVQRQLAAVDWATEKPLYVRASLHTGAADLQLGDYYGSAVNRAARLRGIAHGRQTVLSRTTWELVQDHLPKGITIRDMGEHALKDLTRPEHVYQLDVEGLPDSFPPLTSLDATPNNLPLQLTDFVGRQSELAEAKRLLGETRLLTVLAQGGAGKTRLAMQAAADVTADYPDGVFFISLAEISSTDDIIQTIAESIGVALSSGEALQNQLLTYLANKTQLLLFDNFEHLIEGASIVTEILRAAQNVNVIATTRSKLNITGEVVLSLAGLETNWATAEEALQTSGVRLFLDAAKRSNPAFALETEDLDPLAEILQTTGGMPLGILLAAAWVDMLPVPEIASEISKNLDFLETEMGDVPDRQRSVRAVFEYSWNLLSDDERETFAALSVFRGGFTREAAAAVADASLRNLATLVNKSLISPSPETGRYTVHELLRQYAEVELKADEVRCLQVQDSHAGFYAGLMGETFDQFFIGSQPALLRTVEQDIDNIRAAWRHLLENQKYDDAVKMVGGFHVLYEIRGWYQPGCALFDEALDALGEHPDDETAQVLRSLSYGTKGYYLALLGQPEGEQTADAIDILRTAGDPIAVWVGLQNLAINLSYLGRIDEMITTADEMISTGESLDDPFWAAGGKNWRSLPALLQEDLDTPKQILPEAMKVFEDIDEYYFMTWNLYLQAMIASIEQRPHDAIELYTRQVSRSREIGYRRGTMVGLEGLGQANIAAEQLDAAERAFIESLAAAEETGMVPDMLGMITKVGNVRGLMGSRAEAVELLATVLAEPMSARGTMSDTITIEEMATGFLDGLREDLDPEEFSDAQARGTSKPYDVAAKELLQTLSGG